MTDEVRRSFLDSLDESEAGETDWEANFLDSTMERETFSPKQREVIDRMIEKYGDRVSY